MASAWPGSVNQSVKRDSLRQQPERNVASFAPDVGPPIERPRSSIASDMISFESRGTRTEWVALMTFYRTTLADGSLPFTRNDPLALLDGVSTSREFTFTDAPRVVRLGTHFVHYQLAMRGKP